MAGQFQKDVFQVGQHGTEVGDPDPILGETLDHLGHEVVAPSLKSEPGVLAHQVLHLRNRSQAFFGDAIRGRQHHRSRGAVPSHQLARATNVNDLSVFDNRHAVAQPFRFLHQMSGEKNSFAVIPNPAYQVPDGSPRLRIEPGGQLIEEHDFRIVDQRQRDKQPLLLPAGKGHKPGISFVGESELFKQPVAVQRLWIQRGPEIHSFPDFDSLLELCLLELHPNPVLDLIDVAEWIEAQDRNLARVRPAHSFHALHRGCLASAVRPDQSKDFALVDLKRDIGDGSGGSVAFADVRNLNDGMRSPEDTHTMSNGLGRVVVPFAVQTEYQSMERLSVIRGLGFSPEKPTLADSFTMPDRGRIFMGVLRRDGNESRDIISPMRQIKPAGWSGMKLIFAFAAMMSIWWLGSALNAQQPAPQAGQPTSDRVFKNIQVLRDIPVDDFMGTMGIMCAALGFDCADCHTNAGTEKVDWAADTPKKVRARGMVRMMTAINRDNFGGRQMVTCWSCHHGRDRPATTPTLEFMYGPASQEMDDVLTQMPDQPSPDKIIDKYLNAIGGGAKLAAIKSYTAKGKSVGFGGFGGGGTVQIFAKFPDQRTTLIEFPDSPERGRSIRTFNGREGWLETPLTVLGEYQLTGGELDGARLDAELAFPGQIKQALTNLRVSLPATISDLPGPSSQSSKDVSTTAIGQDRPVNVVQGTGPRGIIATLYFDQESGLLLRVVRYGKSPIGRVPTQVDYADYREVDGIKMPFRMIFAWMDGRDAIQLSEVKTNVPIEEARFGKPAPKGR